MPIGMSGAVGKTEFSRPSTILTTAVVEMEKATRLTRGFLLDSFLLAIVYRKISRPNDRPWNTTVSLFVCRFEPVSGVKNSGRGFKNGSEST